MWKQDRLDNLMELIIDHRGLTPKKLGGDWSSKGIPAISAKNIKTGRIVNHDDIRYVSSDLYEKWMPEKLEAGDILLTSEAPLGEIYYLAEKKDLVLSQRLFGLRTDKTKLDPKYLYYYLQGAEGRHELLKRLSGTAAEGIRQAELRQILIKYPENLRIQSKISSIISRLDEKIVLNNKIVEKLELVAQLVYKEWFMIQGNKVLSESTWRLTTLAEVADIIMGQSPPSEDYNIEGKGLPFHQGVTYFGRRYPTHKIFCTNNPRKAAKGDILLSVRAPVGRLNIADRELSLGRGLASVRNKNGSQSFLFYQLRNVFKKEDSFGSGSIFAAVTKSELENIKVILPPEELISKFEIIAGGIEHKIQLLEVENNELISLKDILLPKLLRGELDV